MRLKDHEPTKRDLTAVRAFASVLHMKLKAEGYVAKPSKITAPPLDIATDADKFYHLYALAAYRINMDEVEVDDGGVIDLANHLCDVYLKINVPLHLDMRESVSCVLPEPKLIVASS